MYVLLEDLSLFQRYEKLVRRNKEYYLFDSFADTDTIGLHPSCIFMILNKIGPYDSGEGATMYQVLYVDKVGYMAICNKEVKLAT